MKITSSKDLWEIIRLERKKQTLTQAELAGLSGVGIRFLQELERGKESAQIGKAMQVLHTLGLHLFVRSRDV